MKPVRLICFQQGKFLLILFLFIGAGIVFLFLGFEAVLF